MAQTSKIRSAFTWVMLCSVCLLPLLLPGAANALTATVYGSGGYIIDGTCYICPDSSSAVCCTVVFDSQDPYHLIATDPLGKQCNVILGQPFPQGVTSVQGSQLDVESIEPIE